MCWWNQIGKISTLPTIDTELASGFKFRTESRLALLNTIQFLGSFILLFIKKLGKFAKH